MRLIHYSAEPLGAVQSVQQDDEPWQKPHGLWVSVHDAWKRWCETENFHLDRLAYATEIVLKPDAQVLRIGTVEAFDAFCAMYVLPGHRGHDVLWDWVAKNHPGIIIAPYLFERRLDGPLFYYGWDVACGCIWDADAIAEIRPVTPR